MYFELYLVINVDTGNKEHLSPLHSFKYPNEYNDLYREVGLFDLLFSEKTAGEDFEKKLYLLTVLIGNYRIYNHILDPNGKLHRLELEEKYQDAMHVLSSIIYASYLYPKATMFHIYSEVEDESKNK